MQMSRTTNEGRLTIYCQVRKVTLAFVEVEAEEDELYKLSLKLLVLKVLLDV